MDYMLEFFEARYHLSVAVRMLKIYDEYADKRVLVGVIREGAKAAGKLVRAFLIREGIRGNLRTFVEKVAPIYLDSKMIEGIVKILEIEREQKVARVEFARKDEILMEVDGGWRILKISRLREFIENIDNAVNNNFPTGIKR